MGWEWRAGAPGPGLLLLAGDPRPSSRPSSLRGRGDPTTLESEAVWGAPGPKGTWRCQAPSRRRGGRARHLPRTRGGRMSPRPSSDGFPRHLPDKVSSTSSSSGPGPGGAKPSPVAFVLQDNRSQVPSGRDPADAPAPPHRAPQEPPPPARAAPVPWSRRPRSGPPKGLGARGGGRRDPSPWEPPQPRSPSSTPSLVGRMLALR